MFSRSTLQYATRQTLKYRTKLRHRFRTPTVLPIKQTMKQREETIKEVMKRRNINPRNHKVYQYVEQRLYSRGSRLDREGLNLNTVYALQGLGDLEPLRGSRNFGFSEKEALKYNSPSEAAKYEAPPIPYTPLAARKLAEGKLWPPAPEPTGMISCEVRLLRDRSNMSPSAQRFADKIAYHLRRSIKACPAHIGERIDFSQLMIQEVIASRRSREIYIVWATVDPGARFEIEPCLHRLNNWVQRLILQRIKTRPNIPHVHWIFDGGRLERELPRDLRNELDSLVGETTTSLQTRVQYLKELDTINQRMKGIPWFMPYLWNKEAKAEKTRTMRKDLEEYQKRRAEAKAAQSEHEKATQSRRSVAPQTAPPPSYIR
ncbi:unnamed protein product [Phytomonas sp. EM1]|nr:unnamed protein product [Phytomonas sp. EM1]|eukprot:CCW63340.1 unnamed protein product [Phytomonas sp. isolate EM1]